MFIYTPGIISFILPVSAKTTLQLVDKDSGEVIRTIWYGEQKSAGPVGIIFDGKSDTGSTVPNGLYNWVLTYNNVSYTWDGVIGNTSTLKTGASVHKGYYSCMTGMTIVNGYAYFCQGYSEKQKSIGKFLLSDPQKRIDIVGVGGAGNLEFTNAYTDHVCNDGTNIYYGSAQFVYAIKVSDDSEVTFANGVPVIHGYHYSSVIDYIEDYASDNATSGIAVQKTGNKLFVSHRYRDELHVLNKTTGALLQAITITNPRHLCIDTDDNLWMVSGTNTVAKYTVNSNGTLTSATLILSGLTDPKAIQIKGSEIFVEDAGTVQKLYTYNTSTGTLNHTKGTGTYFTDATVTDDKFYFSDLRDPYFYANDAKLVKQNFIAFEPDGSMWINDPGNYRVQHYAADYSYIEMVMSQPSIYSTNAIGNRVWSAFVEFLVNYGVGLSGSTGWAPAKNWGANITSAYDDFQKFKNITNFTSGGTTRTFTLFSKNGFGNELIELTSGNTLRFTGVYYDGLTSFDYNGNKITSSTYPFTVVNRYVFTGFNGSNNPTWSSTAELLFDTSGISNPDPVIKSMSSNLTSTNKVAVFNPSVFINPGLTNPDTVPGNVYTGFHVATIKKGDTKFTAKLGLADSRNYTIGPYPGPYNFSIGHGGNDNAGNGIVTLANNIITGNNNEFYNQSQANMYNHAYENGAVIGQFGATGPKTMEAPPRMAGNVKNPILVAGTNSDVMYLWHGDESYHAGVHRWTISGLDSINMLTKEIYFSQGMFLPAPKPGVSIMPSVAYTQTYDGPRTVSNITVPANITAKSNVTNYSRTLPDLFIQFSRDAEGSNDESPSGLKKIPFDLGEKSGAWKIVGDFSYAPGAEQGGAMKQYLDVLDTAGKIIIRLTNTFTYVDNDGNSTNTLYVNGQLLLTGKVGDVNPIIFNVQPLEIGTNGSNVYLKLGSYIVTTTKFDAASNINQPKTFQPSFQGGFNPTGRSMAFAGMNIIQ